MQEQARTRACHRATLPPPFVAQVVFGRQYHPNTMKEMYTKFLAVFLQLTNPTL